MHEFKIFQHQNLLNEEFNLDEPSINLEVKELSFGEVQNCLPDLLLHVYLNLDTEFWTTYFSETLSSGTIEAIKFTLNKIGKAIINKKFKYLQSSGLKEVEVNYGFKAHPKKGYTIECHIKGESTDAHLKDFFKHVEHIVKQNPSGFYGAYELDAQKETIVTKKRNKKLKKGK